MQLESMWAVFCRGVLSVRAMPTLQTSRTVQRVAPRAGTVKVNKSLEIWMQFCSAIPCKACSSHVKDEPKLCCLKEIPARSVLKTVKSVMVSSCAAQHRSS